MEDSHLSPADLEVWNQSKGRCTRCNKKISEPRRIPINDKQLSDFFISLCDDCFQEAGAVADSRTVLGAIRAAIIRKKQVTAIYDGYFRKMCPHALGFKNERQQALFYQFGGESRTGLNPPGSPHNWRCLLLDKLEQVESREGEWYTAPNYSLVLQTCIDDIDEAVPR